MINVSNNANIVRNINSNKTYNICQYQRYSHKNENYSSENKERSKIIIIKIKEKTESNKVKKMLDADCQRYTMKGSEEIIVKEVE